MNQSGLLPHETNSFNVVILVDLGHQVGLGHYSRAVALAEVLSDMLVQVFLVAPETDLEFSKSIPREVKRVKRLASSPSAEANWIVEFIENIGGAFLIIDDYDVGADFRLVLTAAGVKWAEFSASGLVLEGPQFIISPGPQHNREPPQNRSKQKRLAGPSYAILRKEFRDAIVAPTRNPVKSVLVISGGGDDRGLSEFVLNCLVSEPLSNLRLTVVSGKSNPNQQRLTQLALELGVEDRVKICTNPPRVSDVMMKSDIAISAGGVTTFELARCAVPMILISIADNQENQCRGWNSRGAAIYLGAVREIRAHQLLDAFRELMLNTNKRLAMAQRAHQLVDGHGAQRLVSEISKNWLGRDDVR